MSKDFLNTGIIGGNAGISRRGFRKIKTEIIDKPNFNVSFFEAFPTVWANAYSFHRGLEQKEFSFIEEWIVLLSLHYFGVVHLEKFEKDTLTSEYDWDLWKSLHRTYPPGLGELQSVELLKLDSLVVGAYYPPIAFFPSRDRKIWTSSDNIKPYLVGKKLSWEKFFEIHLKGNDNAKKQLHFHLLRVLQTLDGIPLKEILENFCNANFGENNEKVQRFSNSHPSSWETLSTNLPSPDSLLEAYPLKKVNPKTNQTTYYLLADFPNKSVWMNLKLGNGLPAPTAYLPSVVNKQILVKYAGKTIACDTGENSEIRLLKEFILPRPPAWCPVMDDSFVAKVMSFNQVAIISPVRDDNKAYCLLPLNNKFLKEFPEIFEEENIKKIKSEPLADGVVRWKIPVCDKEVEFQTEPSLNKNIRKASVAIYPPQISPKWKTYAIYGSVLENTGGWHLIDEQGKRGNHQQVKNDEYVCVCNSSDALPNRPRALIYIDQNDDENGVLFLKQEELKENNGERMKSAKLAVDFGTSNTCLAYSIDGKKGEILKFSMSPLFLWGEPSDIESPGFVPKKWGGERGFFPTALFSLKKFSELSRISDPDQLTLDNLFQVDAVSLHKGIEGNVVVGNWDDTYEIHLDLKWGESASEPWRSLFLRLILFYAQAEMFFLKDSIINQFVFTYPLAFGKEMKDQYHQSSVGAAEWVRNHCYDE
nr:hypothetical protein [Pyrinomonadaceae bacterium]